MNLKKTLISVAGAFAIAGSMMAPVGFADSPIATGTGSGEVTVKDNGVLEVSICSGLVDFPDASINTSSGAVVGTQLTVCYNDTKLHRNAFTTFMHAEAWTSSESSETIPAANLTPTYLHNTQSVQLASPVGKIYGDWGGGQAGPDLIGSAAVGHAWTAGDLSTPKQISHGDTGRGTTATVGAIDLQLTVPANIGAGDYSTTITVDIMDGRGAPAPSGS